MRKGIQFAFCLLLPLMVGYISGFFVETEGWYEQLQKPSWTPSGTLIMRVWITLYLLMGVAFFAFLNSNTTTRQMRAGIVVFLFQLLLNFGWSFIFFYLQEPGWALTALVLLWVSILLTIVIFIRVSRLAGLVLLPYIGWASFAGYLNYSIWQLN
ncbi:MAG: TspO/MBR family protein [Chitinophagaceae bacterium]